MTFKYDNVYINNWATVTGPYEKNGPFGNLFDKSYDDLYFDTKTWEDAESKLISDSVNILLKKINKKTDDIDLMISGDLLNQLTSSNYAANELKIPFMGVYNACATSTLALTLAANMIDKDQIKNCIVSVSSHNNAAEKQFRYPVEYGGPKPKTTTFTVTGGASSYLSSEKVGIKIESATIGKVMELGVKDAYNMGAVMTPACAYTIYKHLKDTNRDISYYDKVYSGDLGRYGKDLIKEYMKTEYGIELNNYDDTACMIYNIDNQKVYAGGSGPACLPLVAYTHIFKEMQEHNLKKVLLVATGSLHSVSMVNEKHTIPSIAHAISLEVIE